MSKLELLMMRALRRLLWIEKELISDTKESIIPYLVASVLAPLIATYVMFHQKSY